MTIALYRRYRPETFGEMIGQSQVTEPLMTALRGDRVGHAYLFSGPRGCGKTTSARILARCLNCAQGPTDTPCGVCDSCIELSRGGGGSLDVVEIDAASHGGVDDARDLRERAIFAPARDRYKIFIIDEAHMVTSGGFNALLKLVEEPPEHVKFIFATTEPEKVIGTIRSRTHHYPFRLVPPAAMLEYVESLCGVEGVRVEPGVLPLVVRAGGGSPRDTLSLLDQLIAGSDVGEGSDTVLVRYERTVSLLGYTHGALLDEAVDAFAASDAAAAFAAVDRVVQTGQDPRRFVDDLLERLRDLIVIAATGRGAAAVLRGVPAEELERMNAQAAAFGSERLSRTADLVIGTLDEMTGATSPRLQLELMVARVLARDTAAPGVAVTPVAASSAPAAAPAAAPVAPAAAPVQPPAAPVVAQPAAAPAAERAQRDEAPPAPAPAAPVVVAPPVPSGPVTVQRLREAWPEILTKLEGISRTSWLVAANARVITFADDVLSLAFPNQGDLTRFKQLTRGAGPSEDLRQAILGVVGVRVKYLAKLDAGEGPDGPDVPPSEPYDPGPSGFDAPAGSAPSARPPAPRTPPAAPPRAPERSTSAPVARASAAPVTDWAVAPIPTDDASSPIAQFAVDDEPEEAASAASHSRTATLAPAREGDVLPAAEIEPSHVTDDEEPEDDTAAPAVDVPIPPVVAPRLPPSAGGIQRYGEAVVRQVLDATFVREEPYAPPTRFN